MRTFCPRDRETMPVKRKGLIVCYLESEPQAIIEKDEKTLLVVELNRKLNQSWVVAGGDDSSEVSGINNPASVRIKAAC